MYDAFISSSSNDRALIEPVYKIMSLNVRKVFWDRSASNPVRNGLTRLSRRSPPLNYSISFGAVIPPHLSGSRRKPRRLGPSRIPVD
jgi:hypothetical protein